MKRQSQRTPLQRVEFWLATGKLAGPGVSFALDTEIAPLARTTAMPRALAADSSAMTVLSRRRRLSPTPRRMS